MIKDYDRFINENLTDENLLKPQFSDDDAPAFLNRLGVSVSDDMSIRDMPDKISYGFVSEEDLLKFEDYVSSKGLNYFRQDSEGAVFTYHIILNK